MFSNQSSRRSVEAPNPNSVAAQGIAGALRNRAFASGVIQSAGILVSPTTGGVVVMAAACLNVRASGIFFCEVTASFTGATATATATHTINSLTTVAGAMSISAAGTKVGPGLNAFTGATNNGVFVNNVAGGLVVTGGGAAASLLQHNTGAQVFGTAATTGEFEWSGLIQNSITATVETPFGVAPAPVGPAGNQVIVTWSVNLSGGALVIPGFSMALWEMP